MRSLVWIFTIVGLSGAASLMLSESSPADDDGRGGREPRPSRGVEVVSGSYTCDGTVFTDDQRANVAAGAFLSATSGITDGFYGSRRAS